MSLEVLYQAFIPLFVAFDAPGIIPIFISLTTGMTLKEKRKLGTQSTLTALAVCVIILLAGKLVFSIMGITVDDLRIGGGIILIVLAIYDLVFSSEERKNSNITVGVVPIGVPLIAGPTAITTLLVLNDSYGWMATTISLVLNMIIVFFVFYYSDYVTRFMGRSGSHAFAKVMNLFLAAIAVHMITTGIVNIVNQHS
ncbi:MAG: MarC family protein [Bacteroidetes bacterium]|nr:MarC family protein [Bacteroidota bacterium]